MSSTAIRNDMRPVIFTWLVTRAILIAAAAYLVHTKGVTLTQVLSNWDVGHYTAIAELGYANPSDVAFFWGLPGLMRLLQAVGLPMVVGTAILAQVASALAAWAVCRIAGSGAACIWLLLPMTVFTAVPYTEPFFAAAAFWAWQRADTGRWAQAGLLAALACTLRISGLFLIAGLGALAVCQASRAWRARFADACWLLLPAAVLAGYAVFLHHLTGSWTAWYSAQGAGWQRSLSWPWDALQATLPMTAESYWPGRPEVPVMFRLEIVSVAAGYLTLAWCLVRQRWAEAAWLAANVITLSCSGWFLSVNRAVLLWFPLCGLLAGLVSWRPGGRNARRLVGLGWAVLLVADLVLLAWWALCFGSGGWAS